tara:strand:- start:350 stop:589 length:240 start_codon:yes stop_codon:yes gene_type:complete
MKKNKLERNQSFKADMQSIKKEDVRKLQESFRQFFGSNSDEIKKNSSKLRNKVYFFGFIASVFFVVAIFLTKNIKFVEF